jgi:hypothetical protein
VKSLDRVELPLRVAAFARSAAPKGRRQHP